MFRAFVRDLLCVFRQVHDQLYRVSDLQILF